MVRPGSPGSWPTAALAYEGRIAVL